MTNDERLPEWLEARINDIGVMPAKGRTHRSAPPEKWWKEENPECPF